jgi:transcriptional regulator with XRE-family HTH domain
MNQMPSIANDVEARVAQYMETIAISINEACESGDSCTAIARRIGVHRDMISGIRNRSYGSTPNLSIIVALCDELGITFKLNR